MEELKILILEDVIFDAELIEYEMRREGLKFSAKRVETKDEFVNALKELKPDLILADHSLPQFDGLSALRIATKMLPRTPFIFVSGKIGEELAVEALKKGAKDYVFKNNLSKLVPTIERALKEVNELKELEIAEKTLRSREEQLRLITDNMLDMVAQIDEQGVFQYFSPSIKKVLGYQVNDVINKSYLDILKFIHPEDVKKVETVVKEILATSSPKIIEYRCKHVDGNYLWLESIINPLINEKREIYGGVITTHNITELKKSQEALLKINGDLELKVKERTLELKRAHEKVASEFEKLKVIKEALQNSEERLKAVIYGSPIPTFVIDKNHKVVYWNKALEECSGIMAKDVIGTNQQWKAFYDFKRPCMCDMLVEGDIPGMGQWYEDKCRKSEFVEDAYEAVDFFSSMGNNGMWLYFTAAAIKDSKGNIVGAIETLENISQVKEAEKALKKSEVNFRNLISKNADGIIVLDSDEIVNFVNPAAEELFNRSSEEFIGESFGFPLLTDKITEINITRKGGESIIAEMRIVKTEWEEKKAYLVSLRDVTKYKDAEEKIKKSLEEKEALLKEVHHRVKNNMQIMTSLLSLQSRHFKDPKLFDVFQESQARIKSMAMIHEKLYQSDDLARINFAEYIESLVLELFSAYSNDPALISLKMDLDDVLMSIDSAIPSGLLVNELVTNSLKHAFPDGKKGEISLELHSNDNHYITISDNGVGLPSDLELKDAKTLGLQLVQTLVNQLEGTIELDRSHGTAFKIKFKRLKYKERI